MTEKQTTDPYWYFSGIASGIACCFTHPVDLVRVNMQSQLPHISAMEVTRSIIRYRGILGLYHKLIPAVQRQVTYSVTRFSIYETAKNRGLVDSFWRKVQFASVSGFIAGFVSTPLEKVNVRMRIAATRPRDPKREYYNTPNGLRRLYAEGGIRNIFNEAMSSSLRGMCMTVGQLSVYDQVKEKMLENDTVFTDNWETFFIASLIAGGIATILTTPIEVVKNLGMAANMGEYRDITDVIRRISQLRGYRGFFKGLWPSFFRTVPQTILTFLMYEELRLNFGK